MRQWTAAVVGIVILLVVANAQRTSLGDDADRRAGIDAIFAEYDKTTSPGCAVGVYQNGSIVFRRAYGMANLDHDVRLTPASVFHVASVSKQFTATAILLLAQDGKLSVDDDVRKYVPELPDFGQKITIRHLATHTSGIRDQWSLLGLAGWRYSRDLITDEDVLELLARQKDLNFTPGERHLYSNSGFTLLAVIASRVSGQSFRDFTTARIFKPLGMTHTHFRDNFNEIVKNQAYGYAPEGKGFRLSVTNFDTAGATSLLTTVEDMAQWHANFDTHTVGGERLVSSLLERGTLNDGRRIDYGFGITHGTYRSLPTVGHGGADAGYRSSFLRFPDSRLGVACLCNVSTANPAALAQRVADVFLPGTLPPRPAEPAADTSPEVAVPVAQLARYEGIYWSETESDARRFVLEKGKLLAAFGDERVPLKSLGKGVFVMTAAARSRITFEDGPGDVSRLRMGPAETDVYVRDRLFVPTRAELDEFAGIYRSDEMDAVFRMAVADAGLRLERSKNKPAPLEPTIRDTFRGQPGTIQFVRTNGRVSGFLLEAGRVRHVRFWKDASATRPSTSVGR
jgi:CubicO group peptidase (beta-lactamase class C family)